MLNAIYNFIIILLADIKILFMFPTTLFTIPAILGMIITVKKKFF